MEITTDHYFSIGATHLTAGKPCQDYAISGVYQGAGIAIVCDGCSTARFTDVGARVLGHSTVSAIKEHWSTFRNPHSQGAVTEIALRQRLVTATVREAMNLIPKDMYATCIYAYVAPCGGIVHLQGDGVVAVVYANGTITMQRFEWQNNTPFYPVYLNSPDLESFIAAHGGDITANRLTEELATVNSEGDVIGRATTDYALQDGIRGITLSFAPSSLEKIKFIAVFSDGVTQVDSVDWETATREFLAFKTTAGEFAKRRMISGIKATHKHGRGPLDDIAYAVVHLTHDDEGAIEESNVSQG